MYQRGKTIDIVSFLIHISNNAFAKNFKWTLPFQSGLSF